MAPILLLLTDVLKNSSERRPATSYGEVFKNSLFTFEPNCDRIYVEQVNKSREEENEIVSRFDAIQRFYYEQEAVDYVNRIRTLNPTQTCRFTLNGIEI